MKTTLFVTTTAIIALTLSACGNGNTPNDQHDADRLEDSLAMYNNSQDPAQPSQGQTQEENIDFLFSDMETWVTYTSDELVDGWRLSIMHPEGVEADMVGEEGMSVKYVGPESPENSEITDGFYASITLHPEALVDYYIEEDDVLGEVKEGNYRGQDAKMYETMSELGEGNRIKHIVFQLAPGREGHPAIVMDIAYSTNGEKSEKYEDALGSILGTLSFFTEPPVS